MVRSVAGSESFARKDKMYRCNKKLLRFQCNSLQITVTAANPDSILKKPQTRSFYFNYKKTLKQRYRKNS